MNKSKYKKLLKKIDLTWFMGLALLFFCACNPKPTINQAKQPSRLPYLSSAFKGINGNAKSVKTTSFNAKYYNEDWIIDSAKNWARFTDSTIFDTSGNCIQRYTGEKKLYQHHFQYDTNNQLQQIKYGIMKEVLTSWDTNTFHIHIHLDQDFFLMKTYYLNDSHQPDSVYVYDRDSVLVKKSVYHYKNEQTKSIHHFRISNDHSFYRSGKQSFSYLEEDEQNNWIEKVEKYTVYSSDQTINSYRLHKRTINYY